MHKTIYLCISTKKILLMIYSMTGFGRELLEYNGKKITIDIRTLNSKSADISTRLPNQYKEKDIDIRRMLSQGLQRGKIDFSISVENEQTVNPINSAAVIAAYKSFADDCRKNNVPISETDNSLLSSLIRMPELQLNGSDELTDEEWAAVESAIQKSIDRCCEYRKEEGRILEKDVLAKIDSILSLLGRVPQYEAERISVIKDKIRQALNELNLNDSNSENRYEQEIIYYLEKLDINEEKVRLRKHCEYFIETAKSEDASGRKLGFIAQEMGREINTLGSKAHHAEMQKIVVMMKDELEKIKEQSLNIL